MGIRFTNIIRGLRAISLPPINAEINQGKVDKFNDLYHKYYTLQEELNQEELEFLAKLEIDLAMAVNL